MLKTKRLELVELDEKYAPDLYELWSDFETIKFTNMQQIESIEECEERIEMFRSHTHEQVKNIFIILLSNKAIGIIGAPIIDIDNGRFGFFYQISRRYWGNGYTSEAAEALKSYIIKHFPDAVIQADAVEENIASRTILEKLGFQEKGIEKEGFRRNGFIKDLVKYEFGG